MSNEPVAPAIPKVPVPKAAPKWETDARERIKAAVRGVSKPLTGLLERDANEGDTRHLVTDSRATPWLRQVRRSDDGVSGQG